MLSLMPSKLPHHIAALALLAAVFYVRLVTQSETSGDLLLVTLIVGAWYADGPLMATALGASALGLSLYPHFAGTIALTLLIPFLVFFAHRAGVLARWRPWVANIALAVFGVLIFHAVLQPQIFMLVPFQIARGSVYALLYAAVLFGILREIYVQEAR